MRFRLFPSINAWISDRFDEHYAALVQGARENRDVKPVLRKLGERLYEYDVPKDLLSGLAIFGLAAHYSMDGSGKGVVELVTNDISLRAHRIWRVDQISHQNSDQNSNWYMGQEDLARSIDLPNLGRLII